MSIEIQKRSWSFVWLAALLISSTAGIKSVSAAEDTPDKKPIIGINMDMNGKEGNQKEAYLSSAYYQAIQKAGGIPVLLPPMPAADLHKVLLHLDGIMMTGGDDYPPSLYGKSTEPLTVLMSQERSDFDIALAKEAVAHLRLPVLGICAGCQALNIGGGGSLIQDIPSGHPESKVVHRTKGTYSKHIVHFEPNTRLSRIYSAPLSVPTAHHQCVEKVGTGFHVAGKAEDGLTEAIEKDGARFVVGVQYHPERDYEHNHGLFEEFIRQASENHRQSENVARN